MLEGTWVTEEVKLAVRNGYKVIKIFPYGIGMLLKNMMQSKKAGVFSRKT
jgi:hypothetical protein